MDSIDLRIADLAALHDMAETADRLPSYHELTEGLSHTAWQIDVYVDNDEPLYVEREAVLGDIRCQLDEDTETPGEIDQYDRNRFANHLLHVYTVSAQAHVDMGVMEHHEAYGAIPEVIAHTIDAECALWREGR